MKVLDDTANPTVSPTAALLEIDRLAVAFGDGDRAVEVVRSASLSVGRGESVGLVGESGSGKTLTSLAAMGLVQILGGRVTSGRIVFDGQELTRASTRQWREVRGKRISMIFQQPMRSLNPAFTVGDQISEAVRLHLGLGRRAATARAVELLDRVQIPDARSRVRDYPHQFSGGMCQRVMIAMALSCEPDLVIADEPTTALDVTVQATILDLLRDVVSETGCSLLYISHDLAVVSQLCSRLTVMYAGETVETGAVGPVFASPRHPYTSGLIGCIPRVDASPDRLAAIPGTVPPPTGMPPGCRFHLRCSFAEAGRCDGVHPQLEPCGPDHQTRCVRHTELQLAGAYE